MSPVFLLALIVIAVVAFVAIWLVNKKDQPSAQNADHPAALPTSDEHSILNLRKGGLYSLRAFGNDMDDLDVQITARHMYSDEDSEWFELEGETGGQKVWLTVCEDDELELSITLQKMKIDDIDVSIEELEKFARDQENGKSGKRPEFIYEGRRYTVDCYDEAYFHKNAVKSSKEYFEYWEFESDDEARAISVEKWSDGSLEVHISQTINENQITIFSVSGSA